MRMLDYKETATRGNYDFPVEAYGVGPAHPRYRMPLHWHEEYEIIRIVRGSFHYTIGQQSAVAGPGAVLFAGSGVFHGGVPQSSEYRCVVFDPSLLAGDEGSAGGKLLAAFHRGDLRVQACLPPGDEAPAALFDRLFDLLTQRPPGLELQAQGLLYQFFGLIIQRGYCAPDGGSGSQKWAAQLKDAIGLIETAYDTPLTLADLAQAAGMSEKYFCQFFRQMTRFTPIEYLNRHRIEVACYRLMAGGRNVTEIAYDCGFNDLSYFIRVFKQVVGVTPKQYAIGRRAAREDA